MKAVNRNNFSGWARALGAMALLLLSGAAAAQTSPPSAVSQLRQFVAETRNASGTFQQTVYAASGRQPQRASGRFAFQRPGKFRWDYQQPYAQLLVSDGSALWSWDPELNQVTVNRLDDALGSTPAAILAGDGNIEDSFTLTEVGFSDGLAWLQAIPLQTDSTFENIRMGFSDGMLRNMELRDNFGQVTRIVFTDFVTGVPAGAGTFHFRVPEGADVIGE